MTTSEPGAAAGRRGRPAALDDPLSEALVRTRRFFTRRRRCPTTCGPCTGPAGGRPTTSTATGGATTRSCAPPTASTAPARARGRSTSRTASSPGRRSRPTTRRSGRTARSTSPAAAPAAPRSPGTPTRPPGCATPTSAACCWRCTARPRPARGDPVARLGRRSSTTPSGPGATSRPAARAAWSAPPGRRPPRSSRPPTSHDQAVRPGPGRRLLADPGDVDGLARLRRPVRLAHRRLDALVLRLVRRPAGRLAAGVRRPDRRTRVRATGGTPAT